MAASPAPRLAPQPNPSQIPTPKSPLDPAATWSLSYAAWRQIYTDPLTFPSSPSSPFTIPATASTPVRRKIRESLPTQLARAAAFQALKSFEIIARKSGESMSHDLALAVLERLADEEVRKLGTEWRLGDTELRNARWECGGCVRGLYEGWYIEELTWKEYDPSRAGGLHWSMHDAGVVEQTLY
ncbi:hypothetical protein BJ508DRAFT_411473 [Ascobolus immersus RN42]|uniref:Uncharacterized protein n=1 Tax=Ascobolus immersus RN42 TaxID=1160509 RepID=A0A3N4IKD9_ASCIM|nr:hypothetical protein BJ508DRAFT_411473 [Ascobolus immersus RN42]